MKITSKGQVTIPQHVREALGLLPNTEVDFVIEQGGARLVKVQGDAERGKALLRQLRGSATTSMSTDAIMKLTRGDE